MKVVSVKHVEDCFDGSFIKEVLFAEEITKEIILKLSQDDVLKYYQDFPRPFFKIIRKTCYEIKGVQGNKSIRIHLKNPAEYCIEDFTASIESV